MSTSFTPGQLLTLTASKDYMVLTAALQIAEASTPIIYVCGAIQRRVDTLYPGLASRIVDGLSCVDGDH